jgi:hypothetical protein
MRLNSEPCAKILAVVLCAAGVLAAVAPKAPAADNGRTLAGGTWTCVINTDKGAIEGRITFAAGGSYAMTITKADGSLLDSERGTYTFAFGKLSMNPDGRKPVSGDVIWANNDQFTINLDNGSLTWRR